MTDVITFNDLRFSDDLKTLRIDVEVDEDKLPSEISYISIKKIYLEYYKNRTATLTPSEDMSILVWQDESDGSTPVHRVPLVGDYYGVPESVLDTKLIGTRTFKDGLFYVYVEFVYLEGSGSGSGSGNGVSEDDIEMECAVGAVIDWHSIYQKGMAAVSKLAKSCNKDACELPVFLEQFIIVWHAFFLAVEARDFDMVDRLWGRFLNVSPGALSSGSPCNCG